MVRIIFILGATFSLLFLILGGWYLKDSYKLLPIQQSANLVPPPFFEWRDFTSREGHFSVQFPTLPQYASQVVKDKDEKKARSYQMYVSEQNNGVIYTVSIIRFLDEKQSPEWMQKTVVNEILASNPSNQLKDMKIGKYESFKTLEFSIENPTLIIEGTSFMKGEYLYLLSALYPKANYQRADYEHFISSFELRN